MSCDEYEDSLRTKIIIGLIAFALVWEIGLLTYAYFNSDEVICNWLWCEFRTTIQESRIECYENGIMINCSEFTADNHFCNNGICEVNGVCPGKGIYENYTLNECINLVKGKMNEE